ncbi:hypothetical protein GH714_003826 [Hevea brasiliensis]|uniref:Glycine-rich protein n=1 Tax=Hevea brasiliensis TaxID=3981 RepID=A0A6A6MWI8_HEVBR|nr:hypothetical protein GH714_003826 [Hevea brasiliensis]
MGIEQMVVLFLILFNCLHLLASSSPLHKAFVSDSLQKRNVGLTGRHEDKINDDGDSSGRSGIVNGSKFAHGGTSGGRSAGAGAHGGGSTGGTETGNDNGNSQSGAAVVPVIVAGAANNNRNRNSHRNAANCNRNCIKFPTMIMTTLTTLIAHIYM